MFELPGGLGVIERRRVAGELELLHHLLRAAVFSFEKQRQIDFEFDDLRRLVFIRRPARAWWRQKALRNGRAPLRILLFLERDLREIVVRLGEFRVELHGLLKGGLRAVEIFLRQQNFAAQVDGRWPDSDRPRQLPPPDGGPRSDHVVEKLVRPARTSRSRAPLLSPPGPPRIVSSSAARVCPTGFCSQPTS